MRIIRLKKKIVKVSCGNAASSEFMCPCCGKYSLEESGGYEICPVCGWEDDPVQRDDPDFAGGANSISLNEAKRLFAERTCIRNEK